MSIITAKAVITAEDRTGATFDKLARKVDQAAKGLKKSVDLGNQAKSVDKLAGAYDGAAKAAAALAKTAAVGKELDKTARAARDLSTALSARALPLRGFSDGFKRDVAAMKLPMSDLRGIVRDYVRMQAEQSRAVAAIANPRIRQQIIDRDQSQVLAQLRDRARRRRSERDLVESLRPTPEAGAPHGPQHGAGPVARGAAGLVAGYGAQRVGRYVVARSADSAREGARDYLAGLTEQDEARIRHTAAETTARYPSVDATTMHERLRDTSMSMGSVDKAVAVADTIGRMMTVLQSLKGKDQALEESRRFFSALDNLGKNVEPDQVRRLAHGYTKALGVEGADMNMGDLFTMAKVAKSGGAALSERFLTSVAPALMQDMGPNRLGTALGSSVSQVVGGRATKQTKAYQQELGLRTAKGQFKDEGMIMSNPFDYTIQKLIPALQKKGVNIDDNTAVTAAMSKTFSNQVVADLFTKMITQREQYQRKSEQYDKAPGLDAADKLPGKDPYVAAAGTMSLAGSIIGELFEPAVKRGAVAMNLLNTALAATYLTLHNNPEAKDKAFEKGGPLAGALSMWGIGSVMKGLAGEGTGIFSNLLRAGGGPLAVGGKFLSRFTLMTTFLSGLGDLMEMSAKQYGTAPSRGPGGIKFAKGVKESLDAAQPARDLAAAQANDGFGGAREALIDQKAAIDRKRALNAYLFKRKDGTWRGWGSEGWDAGYEREGDAVTARRTDLEERRRESNRGRGQRAASYDPLPGGGATSVRAELTGSAEVKGEVSGKFTVEASSQLIAIVDGVKTLSTQVKGVLNAAGSSTTMPHYASSAGGGASP